MQGQPDRELDGETGGGTAWKLEPLEAAAEVLKGQAAVSEAQQSRSTDRRPLAESAGRRNGKGDCMEARATGSCSGGFEGGRRQSSRSTDRRPLAEAAGRRNGRGGCMEARATGSCSGGFEGGRWQSRRRNKAGAQIGGLWQSQLDGETGRGTAWKLGPPEAAAEVLKGAGGSLGGGAFGRGSWTQKRERGLHGS